jgi:multicomponent Na+:H+ antiporter subunit C
MTQFILALALGLVFAFGTYLIQRRDVVRVVWGLTIISQGANMYLVTMGQLGGIGVPGEVPFVHATGEATANQPITDPLVQALVLTAIVIGFGTTAFALVLTYRMYDTHGTIDLQEVPE